MDRALARLHRTQAEEGSPPSADFFAELRDPGVAALLEDAEPRLCRAGEVVFRCGEAADAVYRVRRGRLAVQVEDGSRGVATVNTVGPGELLGELSVLEGRPRSATVVALTACELEAIPPGHFLALLVTHPAVSIRLLGCLSERLRRLTRTAAGEFAGVARHE